MGENPAALSKKLMKLKFWRKKPIMKIDTRSRCQRLFNEEENIKRLGWIYVRLDKLELPEPETDMSCQDDGFLFSYKDPRDWTKTVELVWEFLLGKDGTFTIVEIAGQTSINFSCVKLIQRYLYGFEAILYVPTEKFNLNSLKHHCPHITEKTIIDKRKIPSKEKK